MLKQQAPTSNNGTELASTPSIPTIEEINAQEIFLIEESLTDLALADEVEALGNGELLATFDALLHEIQS